MSKNQLNNETNNSDIPELVKLITGWHHDRNLINGSDDKSQLAKLVSEMGELADNIAKGREIEDDIGDIIVVLINIAERNQITLQECLQQAWGDIRHRKGVMINNVFVKETDLK